MTTTTARPGNGLRVGIVGAGMIAGVHVASARATGAEVVGVLGSSPESGQRAASHWGLSTAYADLDGLLADDLDVVHVCSPNATHHAYASATLEAGIHLVLEKPVAVDVDEAAALVTLAERAGVLATVPFVYRYHPLVREIRARAQAGDFGAWRLLHGSYLQDWLVEPGASNWRVDPVLGGRSRVFADIGSHWFDLVEWVSGERIAALSSLASIAVPERGAAGVTFAGPVQDGPTTPVSTEDSALVIGRTTAGVPVSFVATQVAPGRKNRLWFELDGAAGSATFDQEQPETAWLGRTDGAEILVRGATGSAEARRLSFLPSGHAQGYADCFAAFVADTYAAIAGEHPEGLPDLADGLRTSRITEAFLASAATGAWTDV